MENLRTIAKIQGVDYYIYNQGFLAEYHRRGVEEEETEFLLFEHNTIDDVYTLKRYMFGELFSLYLEKPAFCNLWKKLNSNE